MYRSVYAGYACRYLFSRFLYGVSVVSLLMFIRAFSFTCENCCFLAGILAWNDPHVLLPALQIADVLMKKLSDTFSRMFVREGVVHTVDQRILAGDSNSSPPQASSAEKDNKCITGMTPPSRRYRRQHNLNADGDVIEESRNLVFTNTRLPSSTLEIPNVNSNSKYFPSDLGVADGGVTDDLFCLKNLCTKLNASVDHRKDKFKGKLRSAGSHTSDNSANKDENLTEIIYEMLAELRRRHVHL